MSELQENLDLKIYLEGCVHSTIISSLAERGFQGTRHSRFEYKQVSKIKKRVNNLDKFFVDILYVNIQSLVHEFTNEKSLKTRMHGANNKNQNFRAQKVEEITNAWLIWMLMFENI